MSYNVFFEAIHKQTYVPEQRCYIGGNHTAEVIWNWCIEHDVKSIFGDEDVVAFILDPQALVNLLARIRLEGAEYAGGQITEILEFLGNLADLKLIDDYALFILLE